MGERNKQEVQDNHMGQGRNGSVFDGSHSQNPESVTKALTFVGYQGGIEAVQAKLAPSIKALVE